MADKDGGGGGSDLLWFLGVMAVLGVLWVAGGGPARYAEEPPAELVESPISRSESNVPSRRSRFYDSLGSSGSASPAAPTSPLTYRQVRLSRGTAASAEKASEEYIELTAPGYNSAPINITGWSLVNGRGDKLMLKNNRFQTQTSVRLTIPTGALIFDPNGQHVQGPILLNPGDKAYVITGSGRSYGDYPLTTSFKSNKCLGYVEEENDYELVPRLYNQSCPDIRKEIDLDSLPDKCYDYVRSLSRCHIPKITNRDDEGWRVDGRADVPKTCVNFILPYLNYASCVERHLNDEDFLGKEWRVYLKQRWEMWASDRETITLYDQNGNLVDQIEY